MEQLNSQTAKRLFILFFLAQVIALSNTAFSQERVKIMTYNILNYPGNDTATRNPYYRVIIRNSRPDIIVNQEIVGANGANMFLNSVLKNVSSDYTAGTFIDGTDSDNSIYFLASKYIFISNTPIRTALRDISQFKLVHVNHPSDTLIIYSVHLKASSGSANELLRAAEVDSLRKVTNQLSPNAYFMVVGDFNIYGSTESAYQKLLQVNPDNRGHFTDAITMTGSWNNASYAQYHTQSPRVRQFGGGANGGMDDRFDLMLFSNAIKNDSNSRIRYVPGSLTAYGNDGQHFNDSINQRPNLAVPDSVADAIHYTSDHIPVYALFDIGSTTGLTQNITHIPSGYTLSQNFPNPFNPSTTITYTLASVSDVSLRVYDISGKEVATLINRKRMNAGEYTVNFNASKLSSGVYFYTLKTNKFTQTRKMILMK